MLYNQKFPEGRAQFSEWAAQHPDDPFGQVTIAASYLFEESYHQDVLTIRRLWKKRARFRRIV